MCFRCCVTDYDVKSNQVIVSPAGMAHLGYAGYSRTHCGIDVSDREGWRIPGATTTSEPSEAA